MALPDKELIKGINRGDQDAFRQLYEKYSGLLFAFISHQAGNDKEIVPDIWQETWITAVEKISGFQYRSNIFTWLCAVAKNKIADHYRLINRQREFVEEAVNNIDIDNEEIEIVDDRTKANVIRVLSLLPDKHRNLLMERYLEDKSIEEISSETGKSYKATESLLSRARDAFREKFRQINRQ